MAMTPGDIESRAFRTVRKGYAPEEVRGFLHEVAVSIAATTTAARGRAASRHPHEMGAFPLAAFAVSQRAVSGAPFRNPDALREFKQVGVQADAVGA